MLRGAVLLAAAALMAAGSASAAAVSRRKSASNDCVESLSCIADLAISQTPALSGCPDCSSLFGTLSDVARSPSAASACSAMVASLGAMQTAIDGVAAAQAFLNAMICMSSSSASSCGNAIELVADEIADYVCSVDTYDRGPGKPLGCREGYTMRSAGLCMEDCRDGYRYSGSMCKKSCPDGWDTYATSCTQKKPPWKTRDRAYTPDTIVADDCPKSHPQRYNGMCYKHCLPGFTQATTMCIN